VVETGTLALAENHAEVSQQRQTIACGEPQATPEHRAALRQPRTQQAHEPRRENSVLGRVGRLNDDFAVPELEPEQTVLLSLEVVVVGKGQSVRVHSQSKTTLPTFLRS
jgi:hypothetical protein